MRTLTASEAEQNFPPASARQTPGATVLDMPVASLILETGREVPSNLRRLHRIGPFRSTPAIHRLSDTDQAWHGTVRPRLPILGYIEYSNYVETSASQPDVSLPYGSRGGPVTDHNCH